MDPKCAELVRRMASVVGHELRNPLAVINNSSYFLKQKLAAAGGLDAKVEKHLGIVASEVARADQAIADMLAFARPLEPKREPADVGALLAAELDELEAGSVKVVRKLAPKLSAAVDEARFRDAVRRLLENAVQAMPDGGKLLVEASLAGDALELVVEDDGPGIKDEMLPTLFEPFRTNKPRGLGLGLALARKIVEAHGGNISGANRPGGGARFVSRWPRS